MGTKLDFYTAPIHGSRGDRAGDRGSRLARQIGFHSSLISVQIRRPSGRCRLRNVKPPDRICFEDYRSGFCRSPFPSPRRIPPTRRSPARPEIPSDSDDRWRKRRYRGRAAATKDSLDELLLPWWGATTKSTSGINPCRVRYVSARLFDITGQQDSGLFGSHEQHA